MRTFKVHALQVDANSKVVSAKGSFDELPTDVKAFRDHDLSETLGIRWLKHS